MYMLEKEMKLVTAGLRIKSIYLKAYLSEKGVDSLLHKKNLLPFC